MRPTTPHSSPPDARRVRIWLVLTAAAVFCIVALLAFLLWRLLRPQPDLRMRLMPAAAPLSELQQVLVTTTGWRRGEMVTICLVQPEMIECSPEAIVAEEKASRDGVIEVTVQADALLAQGLTRVVAAGEFSGTVDRPLRILQEPAALPHPLGAPTSSPQSTSTPLPDITPSTTASVISTVTQMSTPTEPAASGLWRGEYYANIDLAGLPVTAQSNPTIVFDWGTASPDPDVPVDGFSARWTTQQSFLGQRYQFTVRADDGVRVWIDDQAVLDEWHDVTPDSTYVFSVNLTPGDHALAVEYYENAGEAFIEVAWRIDDSFPEWRGEYFANPDLLGEPALVHNDEVLDFDWGAGSPAAGVLPEDGFSVRWTRTLPFLASSYRFAVTADDGVRLFVDGEPVLDLWASAGSTQPPSVDWPMQEGSHEIRVEFLEDVGDANINLEWYPVPTDAAAGTPTPLLTITPTPATTIAPTASVTPTQTQTPTAALRTVMVQPTQGWVGTNLTVTSSGWEPNTTVTLALLELLADINQADDMIESSADSSGNVTFQFEFPDEPRWKALPQVQIILHDDEWTTRGAAILTLTPP